MFPEAQETATTPTAAATQVVAQWSSGHVEQEHFERFLGRTFRLKPLGQEALGHLLQIQLVQREAKARGVSVSDPELQEQLNLYRSMAEKEGLNLDEILQQRGLTSEQYAGLIRDSLLHERLVRQDLKRGPDEAVTSAEQKAWTEQRIASLLAETRRAPRGYALKTDLYVITEQELGATLHVTLARGRLLEYVQQLALQMYMDQWAEAMGHELTTQLIDAEIAWRRLRSEEMGYPYEKLLQANGSSVQQVREGAELRAAAFLRLMAEERFDKEWFAELDPPTRQELENRFGETRKVHWMLLRSVAEKNEANPLDLTHEEATAELQGYADKIKSLESFETHAEKYSEDEITRLKKGLLGWLHRSEKRFAPIIPESAFKAQVSRVYGPFQTNPNGIPGLPTGMALMWVSEIRPMAPEQEFREIVRRGLHQELKQVLFKEIQLVTSYDPPQQ